MAEIRVGDIVRVQRTGLDRVIVTIKLRHTKMGLQHEFSIEGHLQVENLLDPVFWLNAHFAKYWGVDLMRMASPSSTR